MLWYRLFNIHAVVPFIQQTQTQQFSMFSDKQVHSYDLSTTDSFLWGYMLVREYEICPASNSDLKELNSVLKPYKMTCYNLWSTLPGWK